MQGRLCICTKEIYQIRPYTFEILRSLQPFFEIVATSSMPYSYMEQIIDYIEIMLNRPITEMLIKQAEMKKDGSYAKQTKGKKKRKVKKIEPKIFFQFLVCDTNFIHFKERSIDEHIDNLVLLLKNRRPSEIFMITSDQFRIVTAMDCGFCSIPVTKFQCFMQNDF